MTGPMRVLRQIVAPAGVHRAGRRRRPELVRFDALMPPWSPRREPDWPQPVHGALVPQAWGDCRQCGPDTAGVLCRDGWRCGDCHTTGGR